MELLCGLLLHCRDRSIPLDLVASFEDWRVVPATGPAEMESALCCLAAARRHGETDTGNLWRALSGVPRHTRVFLLSDVAVSEWEPLLPPLPFAVTCLSVTGLRIRQPGFTFRTAF